MSTFRWHDRTSQNPPNLSLPSLPTWLPFILRIRTPQSPNMLLFIIYCSSFPESSQRPYEVGALLQGSLQRHKMFNKVPRSQPVSGRAELWAQTSALCTAGSLPFFSGSVLCHSIEQSFVKRLLFFFSMVFSFTVILVSVLVLWGSFEGPMEMGSQQKNLGSGRIRWLLLKSQPPPPPLKV